MNHPKVVIIDLGSQYTLVIRRTIGELGFRSIVLSPKKAQDWLSCHKPKAVILSGGSASVYDDDAPQPPESILTLGIPVLGICYGMQWIAHKLGGIVAPSKEHKEYGKTRVTLSLSDGLFQGMNSEQIVWSSHGDSVIELPPGFKATAYSSGIAAMSCSDRNMWGVQFHPEVTHTMEGGEIFIRFLVRISGCEEDWNPKNVASEIRREVSKAVEGKRCILGFSGGVDSSTLAKILSMTLGVNLLAVAINTGALREGELKEIEANAKAAAVNLKVIQAANRFQKALRNVTDEEKKRGKFKKVYAKILEEAAREFGASFILQGSLAPDIIESGQAGNAALIKSHHNVGLNLKVRELHPFRNLFKYEIRDLARASELPPSISERHPFPDPGLFLRVRGKPATPDKLSMARWADARVREILEKHQLYHEISQLVVGLNCTKAVGVKGDGRVYGYVVDVRAVKTSDFMTAKGCHFPDEVEEEICRVVTKHPRIVHVAFYPTDKPPATTEFE